MKFIHIFLSIFLLLNVPVNYIAAQVTRDSVVKKQMPDYRISRVPKPARNAGDTIPKPSVPVQNNPNNSEPGKDKKPHERYIVPDTVRPVPVETHTYVRSVLRLQKIYVNNDALELISLLNPGLGNMQTVMSDYKLVMPVFPEPDSRSNRSVNQQFKKDLDPDGNINNIFADAALQLDTLANIFINKNFEITNVKDQEDYNSIKSLLPSLSDLNKRAITKIKHTSKKTVNTLTLETNALNNVLSNCNIASSLSGEEISKIYSLIVDMNILLFNITERKLQIPQSFGNSYLRKKVLNYSLASFNILPANEEENKSASSDDDPRKFNIYIFRRGLVQSGIKDPEMGAYNVSYAIPALADDPEGWEKIPEPASTVHCYFPPARFKFSIMDTRSNQTYSTTEDLFDAQKDPNEKWTISDLFDRHPTYRLIFLLP